MTGDLWRDAINELGTGPVKTEALRSWMSTLANRHPDVPYMESVANLLVSPDVSWGPAIERDLRRCAVGERLWSEQRDDVVAWYRATSDRAATEREVAAWWHGARPEEWFDAHAGQQQLAKLLTPDERRVLRREIAHRAFPLADALRQNLGWTHELEGIRVLAAKTWPTDRPRERWTEEEWNFVDGYFSDQQPYLVAEPAPDGSIDPFEFEVVPYEQGLGIGEHGLISVMRLTVRAVVIDFANDILEAGRFPHARGSLRCLDCGRYVGRRAVGYGQRYCSERCKKRAAKRRYRDRSRTNVTAAA